ncbi:uncharacterized protein CcaverHIS019_0704590 [Cutaneotrichosporon cavernicola]|uniref:Zn(2)-C6 fungal-type domain-containing protein n=1 Tax=Cutaneotrichosporon cavernicola TaxID=279322 RepID=A0AA48QZ04_9TREE|nr:uncharacterized protein CcaverHIS019_0704590 [Cutaneotrichosporon cavernicola]BEI94878.1 hypothetical protein CcaverHIS019_0704590 [Cutaneotrichosporon cavernicola]BEJ02652.1 hypothetical protein CcaverHIS631_0704470 [Cutaneotrichosporon cavernicola]
MSSTPPTSKSKSSSTCDNCRKRKIKCVEAEEPGPCTGCRNLQIACTHDYVKKKPGRKNAFAMQVRAQNQNKPAPPAEPSFRPSYSPYPARPPALSPLEEYGTPRSPFSSLALTGMRSNHDNGGLSWLDSITLDGGSVFGPVDFGFDPFSGPGTTQFPSEQAQLLSLESPEVATAAQLRQREPQLEDVASWANISHFISLYLQHQWPLLPLVHRPTFSENLATRLDLRDTDFRALLLSIVALTISQLPTSRLVTEQYDVEGLKRLQRRCHRTSQLLQRSYTGQVTLTQICIIIFDNFYLLSIGLTHTAAARLGQAVQLAFCLGLHSDAKTAALGLDHIEVQLRRRVFWQLYASDKTRAIPGNPMLINDFQGVCSYPEAIDDDFITSQGMFPQPAHKTSLLAGFVAVSKLFRILSECFFHHRCALSELQTITTAWTVVAEERVHALLRELPSAIQDPPSVPLEANRQVFATQRANILITVAIVKFALYDLRSALNVNEDQLAREREAIAREIHNLLMSIPVEDLASNGESVRGKVFHIACALCGQASTPGTDSDLVRDWCDMFSTITFVQMPVPADPPLDSRSNTPPAEPELTSAP